MQKNALMRYFNGSRWTSRVRTFNWQEMPTKTFRNACLDALKDSGYRVTKSRLAIIQVLDEAKTPLTAREIFETVAEAEKIDQVTVYRVLETFQALCLVHQVFPTGGYVACNHQTCNDKLHILLRCATCEKTSELDVPQETLAPMLWYLKGEHGFSITAHFFQINGTCSACSKG